jgi:hypothetical protein
MRPASATPQGDGLSNHMSILRNRKPGFAQIDGIDDHLTLLSVTIFVEAIDTQDTKRRKS